MQAIVLAGGMGTRLRPLTYTRPKPMVLVANQPALDHIVAAAAQAGFSEVIVTTNYMAETIQAYCAADPFQIPVRCVKEDRPMGTAGAVKNVESQITGPFGVIQGDSLSEIDLTALMASHRRLGGTATIAVMPVENPSEFGIVELNGDGRIVRFLEKPKPQECFSNLANTGFYILEPEILGLIPPDISYDFSFELFPRLLASGRPIFGWQTRAYWIDLGRISSYLAGNVHCLAREESAIVASRTSVSPSAVLHPPVLVGDGVVVEEGCEVGPFSVIGNGVRLGAGSRVRRSVLYDRAAVAARAVLEECVIADETRVGRDVSIERLAVLGRGCAVGDGARIKEGSRIGPFVVVEPHSVVEGVLSPDLDRIERSQALLTGHPAFAGLVPEELAICMTLSEVGEAPAKTLASIAKIPFSRIHSVLYALEQRRLVVARGESPKLFSLLYENPDRIALRAAQHR
ncbi:MAG: NTP transferase domain-containing protein [Candidatus Methylomirabilis oxyfera]|nr:NTP transferase domain-containing protein [Candidatus Methylomirabilis oxyfera]